MYGSLSGNRISTSVVEAMELKYFLNIVTISLLST